ncbi:MAG: bifunctional sulfate adenylyltransferase/adenylylsulfate kinase [Pseudomonadota bacterium]
MNQLIQPHGGQLRILFAGDAHAAELKQEALSLPSLDLDPRQQTELALLMSGAYSPLRGFMGQADYRRVLEGMALADGTLWPLPVVLDVGEALAARLTPGTALALRDLEGVLLAVLRVDEVWQPDRAAEVRALYGETDATYPDVDRLLTKTQAYYVGGRVEGIEAPSYHSFNTLRHGPAELRQEFAKRGWGQVAAFHTAEPLHVAQHKLSVRVARELGAALLLHPVVEEGDDYYYRVRCYRALLARSPAQTTMLSLLTIPARGGGWRELLLHAIVRQNCGCSAMVWQVGAYGLNASAAADQSEMAGKLVIRLVACEPMLYVEERADYLPPGELPAGARVREFGAEELQRRLREGLDIPEWFSFAEVAAELRNRFPARAKQGFTLFFTGLSGSGKSTVAKAVLAKLLELGGRPVSVLDGDVVRKHLSSELGFSKEHRNINIRRIGYVASEITKNGGIAICAPIAPYTALRREVRQMINPYGGFIEIHISTPLEVCEGRDRKGLYAKARAGVLKEFTGISDPYEVPENPELRLDTSRLSVDEAAQQVFLYLEQQGYIA